MNDFDKGMPLLWRGLAHLRSANLAALAVLAGLACGPAAAREPAELVAKPAIGSAATVDHAVWDRLLKAYVRPGADGLNRVDYAAFKRDGQKDLKGYITSLEGTDLAKLDRPEQFALLANLYNAKTVDIVLDKYPVKSIKDISLGGGVVAAVTGGPWKAKVLTLSGEPLSLDDIEHGILRPVFKEPRVHYAVNCASVGCPNLQTEALTGAKLEQQLDAAARAYINHPRGVDVAKDGIFVSSIYQWFQSDFGGNDAGVLAHLRKYAGDALAAKLKGATGLAGHRYDWNLNGLEAK